MKRKSESYNKTKKRALEVLENRIPIDAPTFAHRVGIRPVRRVYAYLDHLAVLGLVVRRADLGSRLHFQITERGLERLEWLRAQNKASTLEGILLPLLRSTAEANRG
jgi:predicted ArsR family transcriptional regulator